MDYKELIAQAKNAAVRWQEKHPVIYVGELRVDRIIEDLTESITELLARAEVAEARAGKAERERDAAVSDLETIMAYESLDTCQFCKNSQCHIRGGTKPCLPKWRGIKEE